VFIAAAAVFSLLRLQVSLAQPVILTQPQSQIVVAGTNVTFSVQAFAQSSPALPTVSSGTLQLWLAADTDVSPDGSGLVSDWPDLSGNGNDAVQTNSSLEPLLVNPVDIGGRAALRFNGIQSGGAGTYLEGGGQVQVPDALTAFTVYMASAVSNDYNIMWVFGLPGDDGGCRGAQLYGDQIGFTFWAWDYPSSITIPTNTYRLCIDQVSADLTSLQIFDVTASATNNVIISTYSPGIVTPPAGYNVGGYNPSQVPGLNFAGDMAEIIIYQGMLSDSDLLAVQAYLEEKYFQVGDTSVTYQWQLDDTKISGATNATLTLTNVQGTNSGSYTVAATDANGTTLSSPAVLTVLDPPSISVQPTNQIVPQGSNVTITVSAAGSALSFQWMWDGAAIEDATNAVLSLFDIQATNQGYYSVLISNGVGSTTSSNALLQVVLFPTIVVQPMSQNIGAGSNVTLAVSIQSGNETLPTVASGTMAWWLKADAGVVTNDAGLVSQWQDQSGNTNNASQTNSVLQPLLVYPQAIGGRPAIQFNGIQHAAVGDYLQGTNLISLSNAITAFTVYMIRTTTNAQTVQWAVGVPGQAGECRGAEMFTNELNFTFWSHDYVGIAIPTNSFRLRVDQVNSNLTSLQISDITATTVSNAAFTVSGAVTPRAGYNVGGYNPSQTAGRNFPGDVAEVIVFEGTLSTSDLMGVSNYLLTKYFFSNPLNTAAFQWMFDGTNITGATNSTLILTNAQASTAGSYSVVISNIVGVATSSNAVITVHQPVSITSQPQDQSAALDGTATFAASVGGDAPVGVQWQFNGTNIAGQTNLTLSFTNVQTNNAGTYNLVATNGYGTAVSSNAVLTVVIPVLQVANTSSTGAESVTVPVQLVALGIENTLTFSLDFSNTILTYTGASLGSGASGAFFFTNTSQLTNGHVGFSLVYGGGTFTAGTQQVVNVNFNVPFEVAATNTTISFGDQPTARQVLNVNVTALPAAYIAGTLSLPATAYEGDVYPVPNGDQSVDISDWLEAGRLVAGLDAITTGGEFQRLDCAPRSTEGDGQITVADWVQVGRYATQMDPLVPVLFGSPTGPVSGVPPPPATGQTVSLAPLTPSSTTNSVLVQINAQGDENAFGGSVTFEPTVLQFLHATNGSGASGALLEVNSNQAASGNLGFALALSPGATLSPGLDSLVRLDFAAIAYGSNNTLIAFGDLPVVRSLANTNADALGPAFENMTLAVNGLSLPTLSISRYGTDVVLSWPGSPGFALATAPSLNGNWSNVAAVFATNGDVVSTSVPILSKQAFYRLVNP
jgi:hypothetical protein